MDVFSIMPIQVFMDDRLSKNDIRVLGAILSFRNKETNLCWPKRDQIAERCNLPVTRISTITTRLVSLGWLKKEGKGGFSRATNYQLIVPEIEDKTVTKPVTVTDSVTVTKPVTQTVTKPVTQTVTKPVTRIKQTNEQTNEQTIRNIKENSRMSISADDVMNLFNEKLPELPRVIKINPERMSRIKKLCKEDLPTAESWVEFFELIKKSDFLMGKKNDFSCSFDWVINSKNALKIAEGNYANKRGKNNEPEFNSDEYWQAIANG